MKRNFDRAERVGVLIQRTLATMLRNDMSDERFQLVTVTGVNLTRDFSYAKVFVSVLSDDEAKIKQIIESLNRASKGLRYNLAQEVKMRIVPELKFVYDESTARGFRMSSLIDSAIKKSSE